MHLHDVGQRVKKVIDAAGGWGVEFNTIAVDDGIAMGHGGMLYSLPSRDLIADSVEYMVNAHCADALVCISNCDKITPGMLMAAMRLNIPTIFVSGGPMEAGKIVGHPRSRRQAARPQARPHRFDDRRRATTRSATRSSREMERSACPTCGSCSGMFTANSMNCLNEALGLALPGNGTLLATHAAPLGALRAGRGDASSSSPSATTSKGDASVLPRSIATFEAFENAMALDIAMGGSTNTVLHILAIAHEAGVDFKMADIDRLSRKVPNICKVAPSSHYHVEDVHRAGGIFTILGELDRAGADPPRRRHRARGDAGRKPSTRTTSADRPPPPQAKQRALAAPGGVPTTVAFSQDKYFAERRRRPRQGLHPRRRARLQQGRRARGLYGNIARGGLHREDRRRRRVDLEIRGAGARLPVAGGRLRRHPRPTKSRPGDVVVIVYEGPKGGPGMQEMLYPTSFLKGKGLGKACALITDGRFSGGTSGPQHRPRLAGGRRGGDDRPRRRGRPHSHRHPRPHDRRPASTTRSSSAARRWSRAARTRGGRTATGRCLRRCAPTRS